LPVFSSTTLLNGVRIYGFIAQKSNALYIPPNIRTKSSSQNPTLTFNNTKFECLDSCKYLGMHLDPNLNFKSHIQHLETKIAKSVGIKLSEI